MPQSDGKNTLKRFEFEFKGKSYKFNLNPEEYTQDEPVRTVVTQTLGGAFIDDFGAGLVSIYMKGSTGMKNGFEKFVELRDFMRTYAKTGTAGQEVKDELKFHNYTDEESWIVHPDPTGFRVFRSKSNPLLFMYELRLTALRNAKDPAPEMITKTEVKTTDSPEEGTQEQVGDALGSKSTTNKDVANKAKETKESGSKEGVVQKINGKVKDAKTVVSDALGDFVNGLQVLSNGQAQVQQPAQPQNNFRAFAIQAPELTELNPYVSSLALDYYQQFQEGTADTANIDIPKDSLVYKMIYDAPTLLLPKRVTDTMRMVILETYAIYKAYEENRSAFSTRISKDDMTRLKDNIRWLTNKLEETDNEIVYDIIDGLREIEVAIGQYRNTNSLFLKDVSSSIKEYNGGDTDGL